MIILKRNNVPKIINPAHIILTTSDAIAITVSIHSDYTSSEGAYFFGVSEEITDLAGNFITQLDSINWRMDITPPNIVFLPVSPDIRNTPVDALSFSFSEIVKNVSKDDFTLIMTGEATNILDYGGTLTGNPDQKNYRIEELGNHTKSEGEYVFSLIQSTNPMNPPITDLAGNPVQGMNLGAWTMDTQKPVLLSSYVLPADGDPRTQPVMEVVFTFNERMKNFTSADISMKVNGFSLNTSTVFATTIDGFTWSLKRIGGLSLQSGVYDLILTPHTICDLAGNGLDQQYAMNWTMQTTITNRKPIAMTGPDFYAGEGQLCVLDGSGSTDDIDAPEDLLYEWQQLHGPPVNLSDPRAMRPTFMAPKGIGALVFKLRVTDSSMEYSVSDVSNTSVILVEDITRSLFVSSVLGNDSNVGSSARPFKTVQQALSVSKTKNPPADIYIAGGEYPLSNTLILTNDISVHGGFAAYLKGESVTGWFRTPDSMSKLYGKETAVRIENVTKPTTLSHLWIYSKYGIKNGNSICLHVLNCNSSLLITGNHLFSGLGGYGEHGISGLKGLHGHNGYNGEDGKTCFNALPQALVYFPGAPWGGAGGQNWNRKERVHGGDGGSCDVARRFLGYSSWCGEWGSDGY
ncbi:MAG TPA: DUF1565 domain-containing protein, partial [Candidatus Sumerlaeota bacterium]|nr:DUF1565 domain-containing protein [Candidatus Sumerlaeota bacterium]